MRSLKAAASKTTQYRPYLMRRRRLIWIVDSGVPAGTLGRGGDALPRYRSGPSAVLPIRAPLP
jgi:hypothetical protein